MTLVWNSTVYDNEPTWHDLPSQLGKVSKFQNWHADALTCAYIARMQAGHISLADMFVCC